MSKLWNLILSDAERWKEKHECHSIVKNRTRLIINAFLVINQSIAYLLYLSNRVVW